MNKVVIITGAGRHLGKAFAIALSRKGYRVVASGQTQEELDELEPRLEGEHLLQVCDITKRQDCEQLVAAAKEKFGSVDILVNNAGIYIPGSFTDTSPDKLQLAFDVVVTGTAMVSKATLDVMAEQRSGQLISILDVAIKDGLPTLPTRGSHAVDLTVKRAKLELTSMLRQEAAQYNVSVTSFFMKWVASGIDLDDTTAAPSGATHPKDAAEYLVTAIEENHKETTLPPGRSL